MKHIHKEAFCLMTYAADDGSETETLWNSRDGVTPFGISSVSGKSMHHVDWQEDKYCPDFVPPPGMRIFVDATLELVTPELNKYVETIFSEYEGGCWKTRQEAFDALLPGWLYNGEAPWVITVPHASAPAPQSQVSRPIVASFDAMDEECANPEHSCHTPTPQSAPVLYGVGLDRDTAPKPVEQGEQIGCTVDEDGCAVAILADSPAPSQPDESIELGKLKYCVGCTPVDGKHAVTCVAPVSFCPDCGSCIRNFSTAGCESLWHEVSEGKLLLAALREIQRLREQLNQAGEVLTKYEEQPAPSQPELTNGVQVTADDVECAEEWSAEVDDAILRREFIKTDSSNRALVRGIQQLRGQNSAQSKIIHGLQGRADGLEQQLAQMQQMRDALQSQLNNSLRKRFELQH